jgi:hypothetical protein
MKGRQIPAIRFIFFSWVYKLITFRPYLGDSCFRRNDAIKVIAVLRTTLVVRRTAIKVSLSFPCKWESPANTHNKKGYRFYRGRFPP